MLVNLRWRGSEFAYTNEDQFIIREHVKHEELTVLLGKSLYTKTLINANLSLCEKLFYNGWFYSNILSRCGTILLKQSLA